ncbi:MAG: DNA-binding response regulator [Desulfovibrio sp.]|nr:MAG: DNA-binding response regulator [Desulfovibrio sp.]
MPRILIVDDDLELGEMLVRYLEAEGFSARICETVSQGEEAALGGGYDLLILDLNFPRGNGLEALASIRSTSQLPVIILTGRCEQVDRIVGLEMGADDYVLKPFDPRELLARVRSVLRRVTTAEASPKRKPEIAVLGDVEVDRAGRRVTRAGEAIRLTQTEYALLDLLVSAKGDVVEREELSLEALGRETTPFDRSLDVHMSNLRKKLGFLDGHQEPLIGSVRGVGYYIRYKLGDNGDSPPNAARESDS